MDCRMGILLSVFDPKDPRGPGCHAFVSQLSFLCFARLEPRRAVSEAGLRSLLTTDRQHAAHGQTLEKLSKKLHGENIWLTSRPGQAANPCEDGVKSLSQMAGTAPWMAEPERCSNARRVSGGRPRSLDVASLAVRSVLIEPWASDHREMMPMKSPS